jgi:membrane associated rhomboid family serine protease
VLPLGDDLAKGWRYPGTLGLIAVCVICALAQWMAGDAAIDLLGFHPRDFSQSPWTHAAQLVTSVFLHGGVLHLVGNVAFLWVFGRALESLFGWRWYVAAFPALGAAGNLAHWIAHAETNAPVIGASGAIAALMGAYLALFPAARVRILIWIGIPLGVWWPRAWLVLSVWIGWQLVSVLLGTGDTDGVAYLVHAGGFAAGLIGATVWKVLAVGSEERLADFLAQARPVQSPST